MLHQSWEASATKLANAQTEDELVEVVKTIVKDFGIDETKPSKVVYARDTRYLVFVINFTFKHFTYTFLYSFSIDL